MKKFLLVLILIILSFVFIALPFFLSNESISRLIAGTNLVAFLGSLITVYIAILLYSKYGLEKTFINRQTEIVFSLLKELKETRFICESEGSWSQIFLTSLDEEIYRDLKGKKLLFSIDYHRGLSKIWELAEDIYMPVEIAEKIRPLMVMHISNHPMESGYIVLRVPPYDFEKECTFGLLNNKDISFTYFIYTWFEIINLSKSWLKNNSNISLNLNL